MATMPRRLPLAGGLSAGEGVSDMGRPARWATWATWITNRRLARGRCRERERERPEHEEFPGTRPIGGGRFRHGPACAMGNMGNVDHEQAACARPVPRAGKRKTGA